MSEVVGEGVIHIRTDSAGVDVSGAGATAGKGYTKGFLGSLKGLALGIGGVIAAREVIGFAKEAVAEGREAQKVGAATEQIIKSTGGTANVSAGQVSNLAEALSAKVGVDDEAIQSGANLLLTFKNVRNEAGKGNDVFNRTVASTQDLAAAGFGSIESASKGLGKALNDPLKGITALGRAGVTFTQGQKDQIAALVETGDLLGAQKIILGEVESQVGGVAEATATSGEKSAVAWANLKEQIGTALLPTIDRLQEAFADKVVPALAGVIDGSNTAGKVIRDVASGIGEAVGFIQGLLSSDDAGGFFSGIMSTVQELIPLLRDGLGQVFTTVVGAAQEILPVMADTFTNQVLPAIQSLVEYARANLLPMFLEVAAFIRDQVVPTFVSIATLIYGTLYPALIQIYITILTQLKPVFDQLIATFRADVLPTLSQLVETIRTQLIPALQPIVEKVLIVVEAVLKLAAAILARVLPPLIQLAGFIIRNMVPIMAQMIVKVVQVIGFLIDLGIGIGKAIGKVVGFGVALHQLVRAGLDLVVQAVANLPGRIIDLGGKLLNAGKTIMGKFLEGLKSVGSFASGIADAVWNAVKGVINSAIDRLNSLLEFSISVGPKTFHVNAPNIGHLATGTDNWRGGLAVVGELGPELVNLPRGSSVTPNDQLASALGGPTFNVHLPTGDPEAAAMAVWNRGVAAGVF